MPPEHDATLELLDPREVLDRLAAGGIENVLALRGDPPRGEREFVRPEGGFGHAQQKAQGAAPSQQCRGYVLGQVQGPDHVGHVHAQKDIQQREGPGHKSSVAGLAADGPVDISEPDCYRVSYPGFLEDFRALGADFEVVA